MKYRKNSIQNTKRCIICNKPYTYNYDLFGRNCLVHIYNQLNIKIPKFIPNKEWYLCKIISYKNFKFFLSKNKRYALAKNYIILDYLNKINLKSLEDYRKKVIQNIKNINIFRKNPISLLTPYTVNDFYKIYNDYNKFQELLNSDKTKNSDEVALKGFSIIFDIDKLAEPLYHSSLHDMQCIFWETVVIGGLLKELNLSAYLMQISLSNSGEYEDDNNILIIDDPQITKILINNDEFKNKLNKFLVNQTVNIQNEEIEFISGDLFLAIHIGTIDIIGNKNSDDTWDLEINIHDKYDFTDIKNASDYILSTDTVPMSLFSSTLNNFAAISSSYGVIKPFNFMIKMKVKNYKIEKE